jgi:hypothetical protein
MQSSGWFKVQFDEIMVMNLFRSVISGEGAMVEGMAQRDVNCEVECVNGCILGAECPNLEFKAQASKFIEETSLEKMLEIAAAAIDRRRQERASEPPKWIIPDDI